MIPSTLVQGICSKTFQDGNCSSQTSTDRAKGFADILKHFTASSTGAGKSDASGTPVLYGHSFLLELQKACTADGNCLEDYTVNGAALSKFGDILGKLGFDSEEVAQMLSNLSSRGTGHTVTLAELFKGASQLSMPDDEKSATLDVSAMPDLETILSGLGLSSATSQRILSDSLVNGNAIDLEKLAAGIRGALDSAGAPTGDQTEIIEKIRSLGLMGDEGDDSLKVRLDKLISEVSKINDLQDVLDDSDGENGLPGSLLIPYLQQLAAPLGNDHKDLKGMIASAGKADGGFDGHTLLSKLMQMRQETSVTAGAMEDESGQMSLSRFASALENRIAAQKNLHLAANKTSAQHSMAEAVKGFMENISPASETASKIQVFPVDLESRDSLKASWQPDTKRFKNSNDFRITGKSVAGKAGSPQNAQETLKQAVSTEGGNRQSPEYSTGKDPAGKFLDVLNASDKPQASRTADASGLAAEGVGGQPKTGSQTAALDSTASNRELPGYLLNQVSRQIIRLRNAGKNDITLQLKPPHLGRMKLQIEHTAGGIKVGIVVESHAAKDMLLAHSQDLKTSLAHQGLRLDRIDVEANADFNQSMAHAGREFNQSGGQKGRWSGRARGETGGISEIPDVSGASPSLAGVDPGRLDLVA